LKGEVSASSALALKEAASMGGSNNGDGEKVHVIGKYWRVSYSWDIRKK